jgi:hypothetical protein
LPVQIKECGGAGDINILIRCGRVQEIEEAEGAVCILVDFIKVLVDFILKWVLF